ncbi:type II secretion system minor pseudopilin GspJ [Sphingobium subterraneum]|uniref:Type II secretion system protein J n=1 Tax=Sphingobium subterraneum TaxID=627688 RepID=A0A841IWP8_9SPHN|nr:type II secretion system minor pseudopilin GspJ [Sphingobium subterraneum]MBB6122700.1 general secretion pathway protein J [Sphingobium subterraneum]
MTRRSVGYGFTPPRRSVVNGFTLIELMVALVIFAMLSSAGVYLLHGAVSAQGAVREHLDTQASLIRTHKLMEQDLAQAVSRISRTETGTLAPAFYGRGVQGDLPLIEFVRGGWSNLDNAPRPNLQKIAYWFREEGPGGPRLERQTTGQVDGAVPGAPVNLIDRVSKLDIAYRDETGAWLPDWQNKGAKDMPTAVRLIVTRDKEPSLTLLFVVGNGAQPKQTEPIIQVPTGPVTDGPTRQTPVAPPMPGVPGA